MSKFVDTTSILSRRTLLKGAATAAAFATAGAALAACGSSTQTATIESGTVTIWDRTGDLYNVEDATIAAFNKKYPKITVKHVSVDVDTKNPTMLISNVNVPDGTFYEDNNLPQLSAHYTDITNWIKPYVNDTVPFKIAVNTFDGKITGVPYDLDPGLMYYRADILEENGIDPTTITTYDELFTVSQTLQTKLGTKVKPIYLELDPGLSQMQVNMWANQQAVTMLDKSGKLSIDSPEYLTILTWMNKVVQAGLASHLQLFTADMISALDAGTVIFLPYAIWMVYGLDLLIKTTKGKWKAMPLPAWTAGGNRGAVMGGSSFIIPKKAKNPHLAWLWYEHAMFSQDGYKASFGPNKIYPKGINTLLPSYLPALQTKDLVGAVDTLGGQSLWEVATGTVSQISNNYIYPTWYNESIQYFGSNIQSMVNGKMTPQQALTSSSDEITSKLINKS